MANKYKGNYGHVSGCWNCKGEIDDSIQYRCVACHWVICTDCGACSPKCDLCFNHEDNANTFVEKPNGTITVGELIELLKQYNPDAEVVSELTEEEVMGKLTKLVYLGETKTDFNKQNCMQVELKFTDKTSEIPIEDQIFLDEKEE